MAVSCDVDLHQDRLPLSGSGTPPGTRRCDARCDYDGQQLPGGRSPAYLNWGDGVRTQATGVQVTDTEGPNAVEVDFVKAAERSGAVQRSAH